MQRPLQARYNSRGWSPISLTRTLDGLNDMTDLSPLAEFFPGISLPMSGSSMSDKKALSCASKHFPGTPGLQHAADAMSGSGQLAAPAIARNVTSHPQGMWINQP